MKKNTELLTKTQLENKIKLLRKKSTKLEKFSDGSVMSCCIGLLVGGSVSISTGSLLWLGITTLWVGTSVISHICIGNKQIQIKKEHENIKNQLSDIITVDFEKQRYSNEENYKNTKSINNKINFISEEIKILEKYKKDLNEYNIHTIDEELNTKINSRSYILKNLNK